MIDYQNNQSENGDYCPYLDTCALIHTHGDKLPGLIERFRQRYCYQRHDVCARRWVEDFLGTEKVPELLMPQQRDWAEQLLFEAGIRYSAFQEKYGSL